MKQLVATVYLLQHPFSWHILGNVQEVDEAEPSMDRILAQIQKVTQGKHLSLGN